MDPFEICLGFRDGGETVVWANRYGETYQEPVERYNAAVNAWRGQIALGGTEAHQLPKSLIPILSEVPNPISPDEVRGAVNFYRPGTVY